MGRMRKAKAAMLAEATVFILPDRKRVKAAVASRETNPAAPMRSSICPTVRGRNTETDTSSCREVSSP